MKNVYIKILIFSIMSASIIFPAGKKYNHLEPKYRNWLTKDAAYIITPAEKKAFNLLSTNREREIFINMFWNQRDPEEHTSENEFKDEHYRRLEYVRHHFGKGTPTPGWKTEMGRIYIILGEPNQIQRYENIGGVYPTIIWFYQGMQKYGLPDAFNVVFFKHYGSGDYELYSPIKHGPSSLMVHYKGDTNDYLSQYRQLREIQKEIADVSLTLIEGDSRNVIRPSIASDILVQKKIKEMPSKKLDDEYISKFLKYKEYISMDHSARYIGSSSVIKIIRDKDGHNIVNYRIEPRKLSMVQNKDQLSTDLEINGSVTDEKNKVIFNFNKIIPVRLNRSQSGTAKSMLFALEDSFPLIPGNFHINLLLRNRLSKEFTSFEKTLIIPKDNSMKIGNLILGNRTVDDKDSGDSYKPFSYNDLRIVISPRNDFSPGQSLYLFFQILNPELSKKASKIEYTISGDKGGSLHGQKDLKNITDKKSILEKIPLKGLRIDYYSIKVDLFDDENNIIDSGQEDFYVSPNRSLKRPWVVSQNMSQWDNEKNSILGIQYSNKKIFGPALDHLGKAYFSNPSIISTALNYCSVLFKVKKYNEIINIGNTFTGHSEKHKFFTFMALSSHAMKKYETAIEYYKKYISYYGENLHILRSLEKCYLKSGNTDAAASIKKRADLITSRNQSELNE
ncbi:MAG: GWxTD domain-containing protein [Acidobacteriota bacterium]